MNIFTARRPTGGQTIVQDMPESTDDDVKANGTANSADPREALAAAVRGSWIEELIAHLRYFRGVVSRPPRHHVDLWQSNASATTVSIPPRNSAIVLIDTIIYSASAAAVLTIGSRQIPIVSPQLTGAIPGCIGMVWRTGEPITLTLSGGSPTPGPLHIEVIGKILPPSDPMAIIS